MEENVYKVDYQGKELVLVGTAHVLQQSAELIKRVIEEERPDSICVELDAGRYENIRNPQKWENTDILQVVKQKKTGFLLANLALSAYQKRIAEQLNSVVGQEMLQGIKSAEETGAELVLADRDIKTTFLRIWRKMGIWERCKLLFSLVFSFTQGEDVSDEDITEMLKEDTLELSLIHI